MISPNILTFIGGNIFNMKPLSYMIPFDSVWKMKFDKDFIFQPMPPPKKSKRLREIVLLVVSLHKQVVFE